MAETNDINQLSKALIEFQSELTPVHKNALNPFFKKSYADLPNVIEMIRPLLYKHRLTVLQPTRIIDGQLCVVTIVLHESGETLESSIPVVTDKDRDSQRQGAGITYARRYALVSLLGIVTDDEEPYVPTGSGKSVLGLKSPSATPGARPSTNELEMIRKLATEIGYDADEVEQRVRSITTSGKAQDAIKTLQSMIAETQ